MQIKIITVLRGSGTTTHLINKVKSSKKPVLYIQGSRAYTKDTTVSNLNTNHKIDYDTSLEEMIGIFIQYKKIYLDSLYFSEKRPLDKYVQDFLRKVIQAVMKTKTKLRIIDSKDYLLPIW